MATKKKPAVAEKLEEQAQVTEAPEMPEKPETAEPQETAPDRGPRFTVVAPEKPTTVRVRETPGGTVFALLPQGTIVYATGAELAGWTPVALEDGTAGWMMSAYLDKIKEEN